MVVAKTDSAEACAVGRSEIHPKPRQLPARIGHDAFTAGLVDRRNHGVGEEHVEAMLPQCNCCCQSCGSSANNPYITTILRKTHPTPISC